MSSTFRGSLSTVPQGQIIDFETAELRRLPFQTASFYGLKATYRPAAFSRLVAANDRDDTSDDLTFERSVSLSGITGTKGVRVIGANRTQQIEIDGEAF